MTRGTTGPHLIHFQSEERFGFRVFSPIQKVQRTFQYFCMQTAFQARCPDAAASSSKVCTLRFSFSSKKNFSSFSSKNFKTLGIFLSTTKAFQKSAIRRRKKVDLVKSEVVNEPIQPFENCVIFFPSFHEEKQIKRKTKRKKRINKKNWERKERKS